MRGRCRVRRLNLDGDGQGDLGGHGGEQRAVFVYQIESYRYWREQLNRTDLVHGQFGENFTIEGLQDNAVCIGDRYRIGSILELAEACDVPVRWSCRTGVCHNCESGLISRTVGYAREPLDQPAAGNVLVCCSQPRRDVVIDL